MEDNAELAVVVDVVSPPLDKVVERLAAVETMASKYWQSGGVLMT